MYKQIKNMYYAVVRTTDGTISPVAIVESKEDLDNILTNLKLDHPEEDFDVIQIDLDSLIQKMNIKAIQKSKNVL